MEILIDTNFILTCLKNRIDFDYIEEYLKEKIDFVVLSSVINELEKISLEKKRKLNERKIAKFALEIIKKTNNVKIINTKIENVDYSIIDYCLKNPHVFLATFDKRVRKKVNNKKITLNNKKIKIVD